MVETADTSEDTRAARIKDIENDPEIAKLVKEHRQKRAEMMLED
jgi:hypothetical protein